MTTAFLNARAHDVGVSDEEDPAPRPKRRTFDAKYKARILAEYDSLPAHSTERGSLLRREGLYTSHLAEWRNQAVRAAAAALEPKKPGPKKSATEKDLARAAARIERLEAELARTAYRERLAADFAEPDRLRRELRNERRRLAVRDRGLAQLRDDLERSEAEIAALGHEKEALVENQASLEQRLEFFEAKAVRAENRLSDELRKDPKHPFHGRS